MAHSLWACIFLTCGSHQHNSKELQYLEDKVLIVQSEPSKQARRMSHAYRGAGQTLP